MAAKTSRPGGRQCNSRPYAVFVADNLLCAAATPIGMLAVTRFISVALLCLRFPGTMGFTGFALPPSCMANPTGNYRHAASIAAPQFRKA